MAFERESFVLVYISPTFICTQWVWRYSDFKISEMRQKGKSVIFKDIEMGSTMKGEIQTGTNDFSFQYHWSHFDIFKNGQVRYVGVAQKLKRTISSNL